MSRSKPFDEEPTEFERQMAIARNIAEKDWVVLKALAHGDQYPDLDVETRLEMARKQSMDRDVSSA